MNVEIKENMYVRTKDGHIDKIKNIDVDWYCLDGDKEETPHKVYQLNNLYYDNYFDEENDWVSETFIVNASYSIIDLIKLGDYVNGYPVTEITNVNNKIYEVKVKKPNNRTGVWIENIKKNEDIKSILTDEQFKNMEYRIGE